LLSPSFLPFNVRLPCYKLIGWIIENCFTGSSNGLDIPLFSFDGDTETNFFSSVENFKL